MKIENIRAWVEVACYDALIARDIVDERCVDEIDDVCADAAERFIESYLRGVAFDDGN